MRQKLFTIEDLFYVNGRSGTVIVGARSSDMPAIKIGDNIVFVHANGTETVAEVDGIEMFRTVSNIKKCGLSIANLLKENIPIGAEVFLKS